MSEEIVHGLNEAVLTKVEKVKTPNAGIVLNQIYQGPKDKIEEKFNELAAVESLDNLKINYGGGEVSTLTISTPQNTPTSGGQSIVTPLKTIWEIENAIVSNPIENAPYFQANSFESEAALQAVSDYRANKKTFTSAYARAEQLFNDCLARGMDYYPLYQVVLMKTLICAEGSEIKPAMTGIFRVEPLATINPPSHIKDALDDLEGEDGHKYEFLKYPPRVRQISKDRYSINYSWYGAERWNGAMYGGTGKPLYIAL